MTSPKPAAPILPLTSVRFLAAFYVVLHHSNLWRWHLDSSTLLGRFLRTGHVAVGFFFVLSGFILALVYLDSDKPFNLRNFWLARFARAYPLLLFSILFSAPSMFYEFLRNRSAFHALRLTVVNICYGAALLQSWNPRFRALNPPTWSLSAEAFFYLCFPFLAFFIWHRRQPMAILALLWFLALATPIALVHHNLALFYQQTDDRAPLQYLVQINPIFRIFEFFAGISLCSLHRKLSPPQRRCLAYPCLFGSLALFLLVIAFADHIPVMVLNNGILLPAFCLLILSLANAEGWLSLLFSHHWFVILGEISYAAYLLHSPIFFYIDQFHRIDSMCLWLTFLAILMPASLVAFYGIEQPLRKKILTLAYQRPRILIEQEPIALK